jgi:hypothetical protein
MKTSGMEMHVIKPGAASPGSGMPAAPQAWRHSSSAEPRNAKPNFATHSGKFHRTRNYQDEWTGGLVVIRHEGVDVLEEFRTAPEGLNRRSCRVPTASGNVE